MSGAVKMTEALKKNCTCQPEAIAEGGDPCLCCLAINELACKDAEIQRLRDVICVAHNSWRHEFEVEVNAAVERLFKRLSHLNTDPFGRAALNQKG